MRQHMLKIIQILKNMGLTDYRYDSNTNSCIVGLAMENPKKGGDPVVRVQMFLFGETDGIVSVAVPVLPKQGEVADEVEILRLINSINTARIKRGRFCLTDDGLVNFTSYSEIINGMPDDYIIWHVLRMPVETVSEYANTLDSVMSGTASAEEALEAATGPDFKMMMA